MCPWRSRNTTRALTVQTTGSEPIRSVDTERMRNPSKDVLLYWLDRSKTTQYFLSYAESYIKNIDQCNKSPFAAQSKDVQKKIQAYAHGKCQQCRRGLLTVVVERNAPLCLDVQCGHGAPWPWKGVTSVLVDPVVPAA